jgi:uncharacterized protein (DUF1330 family)
MINILVTLEVKDFSLLAIFESKAVQLMNSHGGRIVRAFETQKNEDDTGQEIHLLEFPDIASFDAYRSNPALLEFAELRNKAIKSTTVVISTVQKEYS